MELEKKLDNMVGNTYMYNTRNYKILKYYTQNGTIILATDRELLNFKTEKTEEELKQFLPVDESTSSAVTIFGKNKSELNSLLTAIKENIELIKKDDKNIPKAKAINESVKSIIEVFKLEIDAVKITKNM